MTSENCKRKKYDPERPRRIDGFFDFAELIVLTLFAVVFITTCLFRHSVVDGGSMERTLFDGEHLLVSSAFYQPKQGDIVVFYSESLKKPLVKRVIATEGQCVKVVSDTEIYVDGVPLNEPYVFTDAVRGTYSEPITLTVSEGCVFVLGDHRNNSTDSRAFGEIRTDYIYGKVLLRIAPTSRFGTVD